MKFRPRFHWSRVVSAIIGATLCSSPSIAGDKPDGLACKPKRDDYFHPKAVRLHESGTVLVEYSVNAKGLTERIVVLGSTASDSLEESAVLFVSKIRCKPTKQWIDGGGPQERTKVNVLFQYFNEEPAKLIDPEADQVIITAETIPTSRK